MYIDIFKPDFFDDDIRCDKSILDNLFGHRMNYAAKGRHSIYHILKSSDRRGKVAMPVYACSSIVDAVKKSGREIVFCDIDESDLNISVESLESIVGGGTIRYHSKSLW